MALLISPNAVCYPSECVWAVTVQGQEPCGWAAGSILVPPVESAQLGHAHVPTCGVDPGAGHTRPDAGWRGGWWPWAEAGVSSSSAAAMRNPWTGSSHPWVPGAHPGSAPPASANLCHPCYAPASVPSTRPDGRPGTMSTAHSPRRPSPSVSEAEPAIQHPSGVAANVGRLGPLGWGQAWGAGEESCRQSVGGGAGPAAFAQGHSAPFHRPGRWQCLREDNCGQDDH